MFKPQRNKRIDAFSHFEAVKIFFPFDCFCSGLFYYIIYVLFICVVCVCILFDLLTLSNKNAHEKDCKTLSLGHPVNLLHQLVCCTELSGKQKLFEKDTFKKYLSGDWMDHLSITVYSGPTSTNQINLGKGCHQQSPLVNQTLFSQQVSRNMTRNCN